MRILTDDETAAVQKDLQNYMAGIGIVTVEIMPPINRDGSFPDTETVKFPVSPLPQGPFRTGHAYRFEEEYAHFTMNLVGKFIRIDAEYMIVICVQATTGRGGWFGVEKINYLPPFPDLWENS